MTKTDVSECLPVGWMKSWRCRFLKCISWHLRACVNRTRWSYGGQSASCRRKKKHFFYKLHISIISLCFLVLNVTWTFCWRDKTGLVQRSKVSLSHHVFYCLLLILKKEKRKKKRMYFSSQSQTLYLIQLCLFISLEGFNRWKLGSSVSNKLDKQTKNCCVSCVEPHSKMLFIHSERKKISEINLYYRVCEPAPFFSFEL